MGDPKKLGPSVIICGSRDIEDVDGEAFIAVDRLVSVLIGPEFRPTEVLSGACRGADALGEEWARIERVPVRRFPADWSLGPKAGPLRNQAMVDEADAVVAICYPDSRGTKDCVRRATKKGIPVAMMILPRRQGDG